MPRIPTNLDMPVPFEVPSVIQELYRLEQGGEEWADMPPRAGIYCLEPPTLPISVNMSVFENVRTMTSHVTPPSPFEMDTMKVNAF